MTGGVDVVVAGLGPVGAVAANLLGQAGLRTVVVEPTRSVYHLPRAAHFDDSVMRVFQSLGLAESVVAASQATRGTHFVDATGHLLFGRDVDPTTLTDAGWPEEFAFYQPDLELALREGLARFPPVEVRYGHEVVTFGERDGCVDVELVDVEGAGGASVVTARWLLGCDGARSTVRRTLGVAVEDLGVDQPWLVIDAFPRRPVDLPSVTLQICDPARPATFIPSAGNHRRWEFMVLPGEDAVDLQTPARYRELLRPWVDPDALDVVRAAVHTFHAGIAEQWRHGRVFLLGDAAHRMPPFLGQGMCAGIRDAANLVWKLARVTAGRSPGALLDTYEAERGPQVRAVIDTSTALGSVVHTTDPAEAAARDATIADRPPVVNGVVPPLSAGVVDTGGGMPFPQPWVAVDDARLLLDEVLGHGFAVVATAEVLAECGDDAHGRWAGLGARVVAIGAKGSGADVTIADPDGALAAWLRSAGASAAIVRPDRYVFGTASGAAELVALADRLETALR